MSYWNGESWVDQETREPRGPSRARRVFGHSWQALLEGALVSLLVVGLMAGTAFAGRPSTGAGHGGKNSSYSATLVVTPDPVAAGGATFSVTGSGYPAGGMVGISIATPGCCLSFNVAADSNGRIAFSSTTVTAGTYVIKAYKYGTTTIVATTSFTVQ